MEWRPLKAGAFDHLAKPVTFENGFALDAVCRRSAGARDASRAAAGRVAGESPDGAPPACWTGSRAAPVPVARDREPGRQGTGRAPYLHELSGRSGAFVGQLRRDPENPDGERILRIPQGRVHRRGRGIAKGSFRSASGARFVLDGGRLATLPSGSSCCAASGNGRSGASAARTRSGRSAAGQRHPIRVSALLAAGRFPYHLLYRLNVVRSACHRCANAVRIFPLTHAIIATRGAAERALACGFRMRWRNWCATTPRQRAGTGDVDGRAAALANGETIPSR